MASLALVLVALLGWAQSLPQESHTRLATLSRSINATDAQTVTGNDPSPGDDVGKPGEWPTPGGGSNSGNSDLAAQPGALNPPAPVQQAPLQPPPVQPTIPAPPVNQQTPPAAPGLNPNQQPPVQQPNELFKVQFINLDARGDRADKVWKELDSHGLRGWASRFPAEDGKKLAAQPERLNPYVEREAMDALKKDIQYDDWKHLTWGGVGVALSHLNVWKGSEQEGHPILVLEDDAQLSAQVSPESLSGILRALSPLKWDVCFLGLHGWDTPNAPTVAETANGPIKRLPGNAWGLFAYLFNPKSVSKMQAALFPLPLQIDSHLGEVNLYGELNIYAVFPPSGCIENDQAQVCRNSFMVTSPKSEEGDSDIQRDSVKQRGRPNAQVSHEEKLKAPLMKEPAQPPRSNTK